jgi:UDP-glucose 4-epimerase
MNILITGGGGFIGSTLADKLISLGHRLALIDNFSTGRRENLSLHSKESIFEFSIADTDQLKNVFVNFKPEVVIHAAASYKDPDDWMEDINTNILGTKNIIDASKMVGAKRIIYFHTALCYGLNPLDQPLRVDSLLDPTASSYAITKTAGESLLFLSGVEVISFRLANAYGPRNLSGPLPTFYKRLSEGKSVFVMDTRRDFVYIDDLITLVIKSIDKKNVNGIYHISSGKDYSIKELFDEVVGQLGIEYNKPLEVRERSEDDAYTILLDPVKTNHDFNWYADTKLHQGVKKSLEWYKKNTILETYTHLKPTDHK